MIRSPGLFILSLILLGASVVLGAVLVHDGEVGTDSGRLAYSVVGDEVRFKGDLTPFRLAAHEEPVWAPVTTTFTNSTYKLMQSPAGTLTLVTDLPADLDTGAQVVTGVVRYVGPHPTQDLLVVVVAAEAVEAPLFFD